MSLIRLVVERPVATWMLAIAAAVFGMVNYQRLPLNLMPDLSYPSITVRTEVEGYAPQEVESQISRPVEEALATVPGLSELESRSRAGVSDVVLEFAWGADIDDAAQAVRERIQTTPLPQDAARPLILRYDPSQEPILRIGLSIDTANAPTLPTSRPVPAARSRRARAEARLEAMDGVAAVRVRGVSSGKSGSRPARTGWPLAASPSTRFPTPWAPKTSTCPAERSAMATRNTWFVPSMKYAPSRRSSGWKYGAPTALACRSPMSPPSARPPKTVRS